MNRKTWGASLGSSQGATLALGLVPSTSSWLVRRGRGLGLEGSAALSPRGCLGLPVHPAGPWGEAVPLGRVSPSLLLAFGAVAWHSLVLATREGCRSSLWPFGVQLGFRDAGGPWGPIPSPAARLPMGLQRRLPAARAAARPPPSLPLGPSGSRLWNGEGAQWGVALGVLARDISCPCLWQQAEPEVPVRSRPPAPPEPPPALL